LFFHNLLLLIFFNKNPRLSPWGGEKALNKIVELWSPVPQEHFANSLCLEQVAVRRRIAVWSRISKIKQNFHSKKRNAFARLFAFR